MRQAIRPALVVAAALSAAFAVPSVFAADYATVISSTPVTASVSVPRQQCSEGQQYVQQAPSGAGAVIGAIAGGVLGHSVGGGFGRAAATGIGAVAGSVIGNQVEANSTPVAEVPVRRCQTVSSVENRVVGYDVMYEYAGQRYSTRMARDPGKQFAVNVQPAADASAPAPLPAPVYSDVAPPPQVAYYEPVPRTVYYDPYYVAAPSVYVAPVIGFGFGYYGYRGGRRWH